MGEGVIPDDADIVDVLRIRAAGSWTADARNLLDAAADEIEKLRSWKAEATTVLARWDAVAAGVESRVSNLGRLKSEVVADELERLRHELKLLQDMRDIDIRSFHALRRELNRLRELLVRADERTERLREHVLVHHGALCPLQTECPL